MVPFGGDRQVEQEGDNVWRSLRSAAIIRFSKVDTGTP